MSRTDVSLLYRVHIRAISQDLGVDIRDENPVLTPIPANAGDAIIFTEALTHGSVINVSGNPRRTLYYCYSIGYMPDWGGQGLHFSPNVMESLSETQQSILHLK